MGAFCSVVVIDANMAYFVGGLDDSGGTDIVEAFDMDNPEVSPVPLDKKLCYG